MKDRIKRITSQVRLNLNKVDISELQNKEIYNKANYIQSEIMRECKCNEAEFKVILLNGEESYNFNVEDASMIKTYETSWEGELTYKLNIAWNTIPTTGEQYPTHYTIFDKKIKLRPFPIRDDDEIIFWAYLDKPLIKMDDDIEPETPEYADRCLIYGICAEYDSNKFLPLYEKLKKDIGINAHKKIGRPMESELNW